MATPSDVVAVWTWLPGETEPVPCGAVRWRDGIADYIYAPSYLARAGSISIGPELPLQTGWIEPWESLTLAGCLRDALPDGWGQAILRAEHHEWYALGNDDRADMLLSGSDRFGAIDFQATDKSYEQRTTDAPLEQLRHAAELMEAGEELADALSSILVLGSPAGGARPKAVLNGADGSHYIAKFASRSDGPTLIVNIEALCLSLSRRVGITTTGSYLERSADRDVLLVERFDRDGEGRRRHVLSASTLLGLDPFLGGRYATYPDFYDRLVERGAPSNTGAELFARIVFNVAISNFDDHARNHAAFWDGTNLALTPSYDLVPSARSGDAARQIMAINRDEDRTSNFRTCLDASETYGLTRARGREIIDTIVETIGAEWHDACDEARLPQVQRDRLWEHQILHPACFYDYS